MTQLYTRTEVAKLIAKYWIDECSNDSTPLGFAHWCNNNLPFDESTINFK